MVPSRGTYYRIPGLPPPASASSPSGSSASSCARFPPRRFAFLACAVLAILWLSTSKGTGFRSVAWPDPGIFTAPFDRLSSLPIDSNLDAHPSADDFLLDGSDSSSFSFSPRQPCNSPAVTLSLPPSSLNLSSPIPPQQWDSPSLAFPLGAPLSARLEHWLAAPLAPYKTWVTFNRQTCGNPSVRRNANKLHASENRGTWEGMDEVSVREIRAQLAGVLRQAETEGRLEEWQEEGKKGTRGIVWTAGNADTFDRVLVSLRLLRSVYNTTLPAEIFHFPSESPSPSALEEFNALNASVISLETLSKDPSPGRTKSFHVKGAAIVESHFDEVLYLDSDSLPVRSIDGLFDSREFRQMGAVFWPDFWKDQPENAIWSILGVQCRDEWTMEAGQILVRKSQHLDALLLVEHMLKDWHFWFGFSDGDKDLFRYAFLALRKRWAIPSRSLASASWVDPNAVGADNSQRFAGHTMLQYGLASEEGGTQGRVLFVHANLLKRILGTFSNGETWGRTLRLRLPDSTTSPSSSASPSSDPAEASFILQADHFANVSPFTGLGIPVVSVPSASDILLPPPSSPSTASAAQNVPLSVRQQALLQRGIYSEFWDGHRNIAYVLAVQNGWRDELELVPGLGAGEEVGLQQERKRRRADGAEEEEDVVAVEAQEPEAEAVEPMEEGFSREEWAAWKAWLSEEQDAQCSRRDDIRSRTLELTAAPVRTPAISSDDQGEPVDEEPTEGSEPELGPMEIILWDHDSDLRDFEANFYDRAGGQANGHGFR
ncbi:hypothetical protein JCM21900_004220 [Sporobolomyces salmonicolor]